MKIPDWIKNKLKKPLGRFITLAQVKQLNKKHIISIGDICTLNLISAGVVPHLAVFDHHYMRRSLEPESIDILKRTFPSQKKYKNPKGTLSEMIIDDAKKLIESGGAVMIDGEEDLTALAFILVAGENDVIVYGQPKEGMVAVEYSEKTKKKIKRLIAAALGHKV
jgi:uncharacterized protein (UPF0218 family)